MRGVKFRCQEGEEEVQEVDAEGVGDDVPALSHDDARHEEEEEDSGCAPSVSCVRYGLVKIRLVGPGELGGVGADGRGDRVVGG